MRSKPIERTLKKRGNNRFFSMGEDMQKHLISAVGILALALLGGCDKPKPPQAVANEVSADQQKAAKEVAEAQTDASKDISLDPTNFLAEMRASD